VDRPHHEQQRRHVQQAGGQRWISRQTQRQARYQAPRQDPQPSLPCVPASSPGFFIRSFIIADDLLLRCLRECYLHIIRSSSLPTRAVECLQETENAMRRRRESPMQALSACWPRVLVRKALARSVADRGGRTRVRGSFGCVIVSFKTCVRRIRSLESHVADIRASQQSVQSTLNEILAHLRGGATYERSPASSYSQPYAQSPSMQSRSTPTQMTPNLMVDTQSMPPPQSNSGYLQSIVSPSHRGSMQNQAYGSPSVPTGSSQGQNGQSNWHQPMSPSSQQTSYGPYNQPESIAAAGSAALRNYGSDNKTKRPNQSISNENSANSSDMDDEDTSELPASGLVAPWEVLRGLASVAIERAAYENLGSAPPSRARTPSPDPHQRPNKRRRTILRPRIVSSFPDGMYAMRPCKRSR
jgi:hypothetical protein